MHFRKSKAKRFIIMKLLGGEWEEWAHFASEVKARREWAAPGGYASDVDFRIVRCDYTMLPLKTGKDRK